VREADHSPSSNAEVKNAWCYTSIPRHVYMARYLVKHRDNSTFYLTNNMMLRLALLLRIREVPRFNLRPRTDFLTQVLLVSSGSPGKCKGSFIKLDDDLLPPPSQFIAHSNIRKYSTQTAPLNKQPNNRTPLL
jgi:hypothetical protein